MRARAGSDSVARYRAAFAERNLVAEVESLAARALPPLTILDLDGWQLRSAGGLTRRANSAWPRAEGTRLDLDARLARLEAFYLQMDLDPAVQLSSTARPPGLGRELRARGYRASPEVEVRTRRADLLPASAPRVELLPLTDWLPCWVTAAAASPHHRRMAERMLERTAPPAAYAALVEGDEVAVARGVVDGGWLGLDLLAATAGLATAATGGALAAGLGAWAVERGAAQAYCEVDTGDGTVLALTSGLGFRRVATHRFLVRPRGLVRR